MKQVKIIVLSIFLVLCNYADGMISRLKRYIPSYTTKRTKAYKIPKIKPIQSKNVFSPKKIITRSYTTENSPEEGSFWQNIKNWLHGKGSSKSVLKSEKKKENSLDDNLMVVNQISFINEKTKEKAQILTKELFAEMKNIKEKDGFAFVTTISAVQWAIMQLSLKIKNLDPKTDMAKLYGFGSTPLAWQESLLTIDKDKKLHTMIETIFDTHNDTEINSENLRGIISKYVFEKFNIPHLPAQDLYAAEEIIPNIIKKYCDNYKEPVLLKIINNQHGFKWIENIVEKLMQPKISINNEPFIKSYKEAEELSKDISIKIFDIHNINSDAMFEELDRELEKIIERYQQRQKSQQGAQKEYQAYQEFIRSGMNKEKALIKLELPTNTTDMNIIKKAYLRLSKIHHPDRFQDEQQQEKAKVKMRELTEALNFLKLIFGQK